MARLEKISNIAVLFAVLLFGITKVQEFRQEHTAGNIGRPSPSLSSLEGKVISVSNRLKATRRATLVLVLSTRCPFCAASMPLYRRLADAAANSREFSMVAFVSEGARDGSLYPSKNNVDPEVLDDIRSGASLTAGISATPTILLLDRSNRVDREWIGALDANQENDLLAAVRAFCGHCL
jgi:thiol-disulfide isomerase/thioredoxin